MSDPVEFAADSVEYLGDGAFASTDGVDIWVETSDGIRVTNSICLDQTAVRALLRYIRDEFGFKA